MSSIYGIDPILDYTFAQQSPKYCLNLNYPPNTVMDVLSKHHPKFAYMVKKAKLAEQFGDLQFRGTIFAPHEESLDEKTIMNMDINTCRTLVKYHFMVGFFPKDVLNQSFYQQLQPALASQQIRAALVQNEKNERFLVLNNEVPILHYGDMLRNGYIHVIERLMYYPYLQLNLN
jgi:hypothetical protein